MNITETLRAALESDGVDLELNCVEQDQVITDDTDNDIDDALNEVANIDNAVKQNEDAIKELEDASDTMESVVASIESTLADGGMTRQSAQFQLIALEAACRKLPVNLEKYSASQEKFGGDEDRLVATQEALEGATKVLAGIWQAMKDLVAKAFTAVKNFFTTLGTGTAALKKGGAVLKAKAKGMEKNGDFDATSYAKSMHIDGKFDGVSTIEAGFKAYREASEAELTTRSLIHKAAIDISAVSLSGGDADEAFNEIVKRAIGDGVGAGAEKVLAGVELPGGKRYTPKTFGWSQSKTSSFSGEAKVSVSKAQVEKLAGDVINFASFLEEAGKKANDIVTSMNKIVDQTKKDVDASEDKAKFAKLKLGATDKLVRFNTRNLTGVPAGAAAFAKQALAFGSKAVAAAGGAAAKKDEAAAA